MSERQDMGASAEADRATRPTDQAAARFGDTASVPSAKWRECPFDTRLARTPYLVLPKLALQAMPYEWRDRFEAMLTEMDEAGLETPAYVVLRDERPYAWCVHEEEDDPFSRIDRVEVYLPDPWANYRHGDAWALSQEAASAIEAATAGETVQQGSTEGESAVAKPDAQPPSGDS